MGIKTRILRKPTTKLDPFSRQLIRELQKRVLIGIPAESMHPGEKGEGPISNAVLGYLFEGGAPEINMPARPHLVPGVESIGDKATALLEAGAKAAFRGNLAAPEQALNKIGLLGVSAVQRQITEGNFVPLAERTIRARIRRGRTGTKPLIDTGQYRRSFQYTIIERPLAGQGF